MARLAVTKSTKSTLPSTHNLFLSALFSSVLLCFHLRLAPRVLCTLHFERRGDAPLVDSEVDLRIPTIGEFLVSFVVLLLFSLVTAACL